MPQPKPAALSQGGPTTSKEKCKIDLLDLPRQGSKIEPFINQCRNFHGSTSIAAFNCPHCIECADYKQYPVL